MKARGISHIVALLLFATNAYSSEIVGIHLGSSSFQIAHGTLATRKAHVLEDKTNGASSFPTSVQLDDGIATITAEAERAVHYFTHLVGLPANATLPETRQDITADGDRMAIKVGEEVYLPEHLLTFILDYAREVAVKTVQEVGSTVLTIPANFNKAQRKSLLALGAAAKLKVHGLIHENSAAALTYGLNRWDNETAHYVLFYNLGAAANQVTIAKYETSIKPINSNFNKTVEHITVLSHAVDTGFSGQVLDRLLSEAKGVSVSKAKEIKERLSKVESFQKITRGEFESVWQSLAGSLTAPVDKALQDAGITLSEINHFELLGGQAAIPKIRDQLSTYFGISELTQKLDQFAIAKGAALYASNLTNPEEIRPLWLSEKLPGHVEATFQGINITKTKTVFSEGSIAGQKKRIKIPSNFDLVAELKHFVDGKVAQHDIYNVTGIRDSAELYKEFKANMTNLLVFQIDASGFPQLVQTENKWNKIFNKTYHLERLADPDFYKKIEEAKAIAYSEPEKIKYDEIRLMNKTIRTPLYFKQVSADLPLPLSKDALEKIDKSLSNQKSVSERLQLAKEAKEKLEDYIKQIYDILLNDVFISVTTEEERGDFSAQARAIEQWIRQQDYKHWQYNEKYRALKDMVYDANERLDEYFNRDKTVAEAFRRLQELWDQMKVFNGTKTWIPQPEKDEVFSRLNETLVWLQERYEKQQSMQLWEKPVLRYKTIKFKVGGAEKLVDNIAKTGRPRDKMREQWGHERQAMSYDEKLVYFKSLLVDAEIEYPYAKDQEWYDQKEFDDWLKLREGLAWAKSPSGMEILPIMEKEPAMKTMKGKKYLESPEGQKALAQYKTELQVAQEEKEKQFGQMLDPPPEVGQKAAKRRRRHKKAWDKTPDDANWSDELSAKDKAEQEKLAQQESTQQPKTDL